MVERHIWASLLMASGLLVAGTAAAEPGARGFDFGARLGWGIPLGKTDNTPGQSSNNMSDTVVGQIPIWLDAGYRITPNIMAGLYFHYGVAFVADPACPSAASCSGHDIRLGIQGQYRFSPGEDLSPWLGLGLGLEWLSVSGEASSVTVSQTGNGVEFLNLQGGADFTLSEGLGVGPFLSFSLGQFNGFSIACSNTLGCPPKETLEDRALHEWLTIGARGVYEL